MKNILCKVAEILSKNKYFIFFKINFIYIKQKKNYRWIRIVYSKIKYTEKKLHIKKIIQKNYLQHSWSKS